MFPQPEFADLCKPVVKFINPVHGVLLCAVLIAALASSPAMAAEGKKLPATT